MQNPLGSDLQSALDSEKGNYDELFLGMNLDGSKCNEVFAQVLWIVSKPNPSILDLFEQEQFFRYTIC